MKKLPVMEVGPTYHDGRPVVFRIPWGVRKIILKRDGLVCKYCGAVVTLDTYSIDHIIPASKGGTEKPSNLVMCCRGCNKRAKDLLFDSFEAKQKYLLEQLERSITSKAAQQKRTGHTGVK